MNILPIWQKAILGGLLLGMPLDRTLAGEGQTCGSKAANNSYQADINWLLIERLSAKLNAKLLERRILRSSNFVPLNYRVLDKGADLSHLPQMSSFLDKEVVLFGLMGCANKANFNVYFLSSFPKASDGGLKIIYISRQKNMYLNPVIVKGTLTNSKRSVVLKSADALPYEIENAQIVYSGDAASRVFYSAKSKFP